MGDDIGLGLSSLAVCFDFRSTNVVQLSNWNPYFYRFRCHHPLITRLRSTHPNLNILETLKSDLPEYCGPQTIALDYVICAVDHSRLFLRNRFSESIGDRLTTGH